MARMRRRLFMFFASGAHSGGGAVHPTYYIYGF